jgi:uncharacterized protein (TIGR03437 family)
MKRTLPLLLAFGATPLVAQNPLLDSVQVMGGAGYDSVSAILPDGSGNLFVLGATQSSDFPATKVFGPTGAPAAGGDTFVAKIRIADWSLVWSAVIRPSVPLAFAIDSSGAVYLTCHSDTPANFPTTPGGFNANASGPWGGLFVVKLDPTGSTIVYSAMLAPFQVYTTAALAVDTQGQAYVTAIGTAPITPGAYLSGSTSFTNCAYVAKLNAIGSAVLFATYISPTPTTTPRAIAVDSSQNIYIAGGDNAYGSKFPTTRGVIQPNNAGGDDAFVMKLNSDGKGLIFATFLGGQGSDSAGFLSLADDGSIYLAGYCEYGSNSDGSAAFPTTANAPFRTFNYTNGFVARLSADATSLLFSSYISATTNSVPSTFSISAGNLYVTYHAYSSYPFLGLNYYPGATISGTALQVFDGSGNAASSTPIQIPALTPDAVAVTDTALIIASTGSPINLPVPSAISPLGPLGRELNRSPLVQSDITFANFLLNATPDHDLTLDRGYLYFEALPGDFVAQNVTVSSPSGAVPFDVFSSLPQTCCQAVSPSYAINTMDGVTPQTLTISPGAINSPEAFLFVSPHATQAIQVLPSVAFSLQVQAQIGDASIVLPAGGGAATGTMQISATAISPATATSMPASVPFSFLPAFLPSILSLDQMSGVTPATVNVTGQLDSLKPGGTDVEQLVVTVANVSNRAFVILSRPGTPPLVAPVSVRFSGALGQSAAPASIQITPPDNTTAFAIPSPPPGLIFSALSGVGPATITVGADISQFKIGTTNLTLTIQVGSAPLTVAVTVVVSQYGLTLYNFSTVAPGARFTVSAFGVAANLPSTGAWTDISPAPTDWNGYRFVYRSTTLAILRADPVLLQFDVQIPYGIDLAAHGEPIAFLAPDGSVVSSASTYQSEAATALTLWNIGQGFQVALKADGSAVTAANPVASGDIVRVTLTGTGVTNPPIAEGLLPDPGVTISPTAMLQVAIGGKPATILGQHLDANVIAVTDLDVQVPALGSGLAWLGIQFGASRIDLIPVWIAN